MSPFTVPAIGSIAAGARRTLGSLAVAAQVALGVVVVLAAAERPSFLTSPHKGAFSDWFAGPLHGLLPSLTSRPAMLKRELEIVLVAMVAVWVVVVLAGPAVRAAVVIPAVVALHAVFLLCPPFALTDIFNYIGYARLDVVAPPEPVREPAGAGAARRRYTRTATGTGS